MRLGWGVAVPLMIAAVALLWACPHAEAQCVYISNSDSTIVLGASPWVGEHTLYLWLAPCGIPRDPWVAAVEFGFETSFELVSLSPREGVSNSGTVRSPILHIDGCAASLQVIAEFVVRDTTGLGGSVCFGASEQSVWNCSQSCLEGGWQSNFYNGFSSDGSAVCEGYDFYLGCSRITGATSPSTWGVLKHLYR